jgi:hypothetical protein
MSKTFAAVEAGFQGATLYSWGANAKLRSVEQGDIEVHLGNTTRFDSAEQAEFWIYETVREDCAKAYPNHSLGPVRVWQFTRASDTGLN